MRYLDSEIDRLNVKLSEGLAADHFKTGLTYQVIDKGGKAIQDAGNNRIHVDDVHYVYFYHRLKSKRYIKQAGHGMSNHFHADCNIDLIVFSKVDAVDYFESKLNEFASLEINSLDFDSYKIFQAETQAKEYDFAKYFIFSINYTLNTSLKKCLSL